MTPVELAARIDQTLLAPAATPVQVEALCQGARKHGFRAVCVSPSYVPLAVRHLEGSQVRVCTVVGFPLGSSTPAAKVHEAEEAVSAGATDIDMVINIGRLRAADLDYVRDEVRAVVRAAVRAATRAAARAAAHGTYRATDRTASHGAVRATGRTASHGAVRATERAASHGAVRATERAGEGIVVKVIIEACHLTDEEKVAACRLAEEAGAHFVKTSTGFGPGGATPADVRLIRQAVGERLGVKASGGIRTLEQALALLEAGADVLGTSAGEAIIAQLIFRR